MAAVAVFNTIVLISISLLSCSCNISAAAANQRRSGNRGSRIARRILCPFIVLSMLFSSVCLMLTIDIVLCHSCLCIMATAAYRNGEIA